jgi:hypothetical protein
MPEELDDIEEPEDADLEEAEELFEELDEGDLDEEIEGLEEVEDVDLVGGAALDEDLELEDGPGVVAEELPAGLREEELNAVGLEAPDEAAIAEEDEEELEDEDVEATLDEILRERLVSQDFVDDEEDEDDSGEEERSDIAERVFLKQPGEFVCRSCFLLKPETQLADRERGLCRDCV